MALWGILLTLFFLVSVGFLIYLVLSIVLRGSNKSSMLDFSGDSVAVRVAQFTTESSRGVETMQGLSSAFDGKPIDIYGFNRLSLRDVEYNGGPNELLFGNPKKSVENTPFVSNANAISLDGDNSYAGSYYGALSGHGDAIFVNKTMHQGEANVEWWADDSYITDNRSANKCILMEEGGAKGALVLLPFIYNGKRAVVFNYSYQGKEESDNKTAIASFSGCMNWIDQFIHDNKVVYFIIMGNAALQSVIWSQIIEIAFIDHAYFLSPRAKDNFITLNVNKGLSTPDFMLVSKTMAPYGVRFGLREPRYLTSTQHYSLVAEIFKRPNVFANQPDTITNLIIRQQVLARLRKDPQTAIEPSDYDINDHDFSPIAKLVADTTEKILMPIGEALETSPTQPSGAR